MSLVDIPPDHSSSEIFRPSVSAHIFRQTLGLLAAGTNIITTHDQDGVALGMTATAVTSVSLDPPLILVCVDNRTRTARALQSQAPFIVHILADNQEPLARHFASPISDKFAGVRYCLAPNGCAMLEDVLAAIECMPYHTYPGGDHTIVVGRIVDVSTASSDIAPLVYFRSQFLRYS